MAVHLLRILCLQGCVEEFLVGTEQGWEDRDEWGLFGD